MVKCYKVILFDLDGTLTDSKLGIAKSAQYSLRHLGILENNLDNLEKFVGPPLHEAFMRFYDFDDETTKKAVKKYREYYRVKGIYENKVYPGVFRLLDRIKSERKTMIIATSKPTVFAKRTLEYFNMIDYFFQVVGSNFDGSRGTKTEIIEHILSENSQFNKEDIVMIGDRKYDIDGAKEVGIDSVGVLYGYGKKNELSGATYIAKTVEDLEKILID